MAFLFCLFTGLAAWYPNRTHKNELRAREGFLIVVLFWVVLASFSAVPLLLLDQPHFSLADAFFESFSGLTTTGATVLNNIDIQIKLSFQATNKFTNFKTPLLIHEPTKNLITNRFSRHRTEGTINVKTIFYYNNRKKS